MKIKQVLLLALLALCTLRPILSTAEAQGTAFTYQGQLSASGSPAGGHYDFTFGLFTTNSTNTGQVGSTLTNLDVGVTNGLFIATLNFGDVFTGTNYWLAIGTRTNGGAGFTPLNPLQELTPTPYAIYAPNAGTAANANSVAAVNVSGILQLDQLPTTVVTNGQAGVNLTGAFTGNGASLTNIPLTGLADDGSLSLITNGLAFVFSGTIGVGLGPYGITAATNLNGLGRVDLVTANAGTNTLTVLTNNGSGRFGTEATPAVGHTPACVAVGDVNNDGKPDLICANFTDGTLTVLTNTGSGFVSNASLTVGTNPICVIAVSNLNGLGHMDLVSANFGTNTLTVWTNNGSGKFALNGTLTVGASPACIVAADVTHLGRPDLICVNGNTNILTVLLNIGSGEFVNQNYTVGNGPISVVAVDVNGDGWVDLVCANEIDGTLTVLTNNGTGNGSFTLASTVSGLGGTLLSLAVFNVNGQPDLVCASESSSLQLVLNTGNGTFVAGPYLTPNGPDLFPQFAHVIAVDIIGNGKPDLLTSDFSSNYLAVFQNETGLPTAELTLAGQNGGLSLSPGFLGVPNLIGGSSSNVVEAGVNGSVIAGGGSPAAINQISANDSSISGGEGNTIQSGADHSSIGGGYQNTNAGEYAFLGGGQSNQITTNGIFATVGGGQQNTANGTGSVIGGGGQNTNSGNYATVGGGQYNTTSSQWAAIGGGNNNTNNDSSGTAGTIAGGQNNIIISGNQPAIGGGYGNNANNSYATISGGINNSNGGEYAFIGGGQGNVASNAWETIGGGFDNTAADVITTVSGGENNKSLVNGSTVGGGFGNTSSAEDATVSGGNGNQAINPYATVPGGLNNIASGACSFAAGDNAQATYNGAFVWSDSSGTQTTSTNINSVTFRASGGYRFFTSTGSGGATLLSNQTSWSAISDRNSKKNFQPVNTEAVLDKLASIPIQQWNYKWENDNDVPNIGPMAQDFKAAFYPGRDDKSINTLEFDGVELAAIQGLNHKLEAESKAKDAEIEALKQSVAELKKTVQTLVEKK